MNRQSRDFSIEDYSLSQIKQWMLSWSQQFSIHLFLDSNNYRLTEGRYECLLAAGAATVISTASGNLLPAMDQLHRAGNDWLFGHINYDFKNVLEPGLETTKQPVYGFPDLHFFCPETVCFIRRDTPVLTIQTTGDATAVFKQIIGCTHPLAEVPVTSFSRMTTMDNYLSNVSLLKEHIASGDCYEINYCIAGIAHNCEADPLAVYNKLSNLSPAPFAALYRIGSLYAMCASPERYLCRSGNRLVSQPIKGTARRERDPEQDRLSASNLRASIKEQAENIMIVDLVRNDLARSCTTGSVQVDELFGIYSFPQVHQMISTISGKLRDGVTLADIIGHSFPMGSMTGAPKYKVMQLADRYEDTARELYSGTIGYVSPDGDFDFNVVIRSLFYNADTHTMGYQAGGAITFDSDPAMEWEEVKLKAWAMEKIFTSEQIM